MFRITFRLLICVSLFNFWLYTFASGASHINPADSKLIQQIKEGLFSDYDKADLPDLSNCSLVRIELGPYINLENNRKQERFTYGFVLEENEESMSVLGIDLSVKQYPKTGSTEKIPQCKKVDIEQEITSLLIKLEQPGSGDRLYRDLFRYTFVPANEFVQVLVLARGCGANGQHDLARSLLEYSSIWPSQFEVRDKKGVEQFRQMVRADLSRTVYMHIVLEFNDTSVSRLQLQTRFEKFLVNHPDSEYVSKAKDSIEILELMNNEDKEYEEFKPDKTHIENLIFQLRDQNGLYSLDIFSDPREQGPEFLKSYGFSDNKIEELQKQTSPAVALLNLGQESIPLLIEHLDDPRFTRTLSTFDRRGPTTHEVITIGETCEMIIERIAGKDFFGNDAKKQIEEWWKENQP